MLFPICQRLSDTPHQNHTPTRGTIDGPGEPSIMSTSNAPPSPDEPDLLDNAIDVAVAMVTRVYRNPSGHRSISGQETTGQFSGSNTITFGGNNPGALELLDDERDLLSGSSGDGGAFEVDMMLGSPGPSMVPRVGVWF